MDRIFLNSCDKDNKSPKKRRIHRGLQECVAYSQSEEGSVTLRQPLEASARSQQHSRNLHPIHRPHKKLQSKQQTDKQTLSASSSVDIMDFNFSNSIVGSSTENANQALPELTGHDRMKIRHVNLPNSEEKLHIMDCELEVDSDEPEKMMKKRCDNSNSLLKEFGGFTTASSMYNQPSTSWASNVSHCSVWSLRNAHSSCSNSLNAQSLNCTPRSRKSQCEDPGQKSIKQFMVPVSQDDARIQRNVGTACSSESLKQYTCCGETPAHSGTGHSAVCRMLTGTSPSKNDLDSHTVYVISSDDSTDNFEEDSIVQNFEVNRQGMSSEDLHSVANNLNHGYKTRKRNRKLMSVKQQQKYGVSGTWKKKKPQKILARSPAQKACGAVLPEQELSSTLTSVKIEDLDFDAFDDDDFKSCSMPTKPVTKRTVEVGKTYGLFGESEVKVEEVNYFERLPQDVVENIFCRLPLQDLLLNTNRVCLFWNEVISSTKFVPWKKLYYHLKQDMPDARRTVTELLSGNNMTSPSFRLLSLIRYMKSFKPVCRDNNLSDLLHQHPKYTWALALIQERIPECIPKKEPNPWSLITALTMVASSAREMELLVQVLTSPQSSVRCTDAVECLYCIATLLLAFQKQSSEGCSARVEAARTTIMMAKLKDWSVVSAMHYHLFYALYLFENLSVSNHSMLQSAMTGFSGQQSIVRYSLGETEVRLTHEQVRIIGFSPQSGDIVKINAFAGTGKTTTLVRYTQLRPNLRFLLIVFNKSVCENAEKKFPFNVTCKTAHGLAFAAVGRRYAAAKKLNFGSLKVYYVAMSLREETGKQRKENLFVRGKMVLQTLNNFLASSDEEISFCHVPERQFSETNGIFEPVPFESRQQYARDTQHYWSRMMNIQDSEVRITHDGYLKLFQLSKPKLSGYDVILVDEAQDLSPALIDILHRQHQPKIFVGDPHQQIYSFRGAVNAMQQIQHSYIFYLTQSFRFGPEISRVAGILLEAMKAEKKTIVGHGKPGTINGEQLGQLAILCRTNFTVFSEAVSLCVYSAAPSRVAFVGGLESLDFPALHDIYNLLHQPEGKREIKSKFIARFPNLAELEKYAQRTTDAELMGKIRIVKTYDQNLLMCMTKIREKTIRDLTQADIVLSTVHKAKGLEFSTVRITDDFIESRASMEWMRNPVLTLPIDEVNLLYVAVTRAKHALILSNLLHSFVAYAAGGFAWPVLSDELVKRGVSFCCLEKQEEFKPKALTLYRPKVTLSNKTELKEGVYSPLWLTDSDSEFAQLLGNETCVQGDGENHTDLA